ncbi:MAG: hypothetical protein U5L01_11905 [Rheinheimera sp.]|nr:hypothetical protein [Rheinheimera sp.]
MLLERVAHDNGNLSIKISYADELGNKLHEFHPISSKAQKQRFANVVIPPHLVDRHRAFAVQSVAAILSQQHRLQPPAAVIARKDGRYWKLREKLFQLKLPDE